MAGGRRETRAARTAAYGLTLGLLAACGPASTSRTADAPVKPPSLESITSKRPGGDAEDPERAALERLLTEPWGFRPDSWATLRAPLPVPRTWSNMRIWGHPTRFAFKYGDDRYALSALWYLPSDGPSDPESCLDRFLVHAASVARRNLVKLGPQERVYATQTVRGESKPMVIELVEGTGETLVVHDEYVAAVTSYSSWPGTCLIHGLAVISTEHRALAEKVRARWVKEGAAQLQWQPRVRSAPPTSAR